MNAMSKPKIDDMSKLHDIFVGNMLMFPALYDELAKELNCSTASLRAIGAGFYPEKQAWTFPERDHKGDVIGISLRYEGDKFMVKGSKRGLIYPYNENALTGKAKFASGRCTWMQVKDVGVKCPICEKPDWCMVSSDYADPEGPSAAVCTRIEKGSKFNLPDCGDVHVLDPTRQAKSKSGVLPETSLPILIVEGASDVCASLDLDFIAIGKPSAKGGMKLLKEMPIAGKTIWIMGENDAGAGREGMEKTFIVLAPLSEDIVCVMPPEGTKDLRQWVDHGITADTLTVYIQKEGVVNPVDEGRIIRGGINYIRLAEQFIANLDNRVIFHQKKWYQYDGGRYHEVQDDVIGADISEWLVGFKIVNDAGVVNALNVDARLITEVRTAVHNMVLSRVPHDVAEPLVISTRESFDCSGTIIFKNGLLDVKTSEFTAHSDDLFTTATLPYDFDPDATCPDWELVVPQWFEGDVERAAALQEWFGYNMIAANFLEAVMFMCGQSGSGKGTAIQTLTHLLGENYGVLDTLAVSSDKHALASLVGKYACIFSEEGVLNTSKSQKVLSVMKSISGNDPQLLRGMKKLGVFGQLFCRITYSSNEVPIFRDEMHTLFRRFNLLEFKTDFLAAPDTGLKERLRGQLPGIANWAVVGLKRLLEQGKFTIPEVARAEIEEIKIEASPLKDMLETYLEFDVEGAFLTRRQLFDFYIAVCDENGVTYRWQFAETRRRCKEALPKMEMCADKLRHGPRGYKGVQLNAEAKELLFRSG